MQLTGKQIVDLGIINGVCEKGIQQQGVDVRLASIRLAGANGTVSEVSTVIPESGPEIFPGEQQYYHLSPGYYEVTLVESCIIPPNIAMHFHTRSSLVRCGAHVFSGQFDAGFHTDAMGCYLHVIQPITIQRGARIAQAICTETYNVDGEHLYAGQYQGDKQRRNV